MTTLKRFWHWLIDAKMWRVAYEDGHVTVPMTYRNAKTYSHLWNGNVVYDPQ